MYSSNNIKYIDSPWNHQIRVPTNYSQNDINSYPMEYPGTDSVFCHSLPENNSDALAGNFGHPGYTYSQGYNGSRTRAVIASKRAAQNRAAQRAFRQRKDRYIKDLERKAKLMDEWKQEMDQLRHQNKELVENSLRLEKQIHRQQQHIKRLENMHASLEPVSPVESNAVVVPAPVVVYMEPSKGGGVNKQEAALFKTHEHTNLYTNSPTPTYSSSSSSSVSLNGYEDYSNSKQQQYTTNNQFFWNEPYEPDFDLLPSSSKDQALNNLYADLLAVNQRTNSSVIDIPLL